MGSHAAKFVAIVAVLAGCLLGTASALAAPSVTGTFPLATEIDTNNKIVAGPDGNIWLTVGGGNDVAKVTPTGAVEEFDLPEISGTNGIAVGPDGNLWVPTTNQVTKFSPGNPVGTAQTYTVNLINNGGQIVTGPDGLLWVASQNSLVHFPTSNPEGAQSISIEGELAPKDIDLAGSLIAIADGGGENRIVTFTAAGVQKDFAIGGASQGVAGGPNGQIAFSAPGASPEESGLIGPPSPALSFELLGDPFGVAFGGDGAFWVVQFAAGQLARVTTDGQLSFPIQGLPKESARQITTGPGGTLWVTLQKNGEPGAVARISGVEPPPLPPASKPPTSTPPPTPVLAPRTNLAKGKKLFKTKKKAKVKFTFASPDIALRFECSLVRLRGKKVVSDAFKPCRSPKVYRLVPGRYRFAVRALNGPVADPTPATCTIRVARR
jgi:streptogramin lyase